MKSAPSRNHVEHIIRTASLAIRAAIAAATVGFGLACADQVVGPLLGGAVHASAPSGAERAIGVGATALGYGVTVLVCGMAASIVGVSQRMLRGACGVALGVATGAHVTSLLLRRQSGSFVTVGAIEYWANSWDHMLEAAARDFTWEVLAITAASVAAGVIVTRLLPLSASAAGRPKLVAAVVAPAMIAAVPVEVAPRSPIWRTTAELSLFASVGRSYGVEHDDTAPNAMLQTGPPLAAGAIWEGVVATQSARRPNVMLVMLESVPKTALGYEGRRRDVTPHLDRLAQSAVRMRRVWTTATHSSYSQMAVLSSLFPYRGTTLDMYQRLDYPRVLLHDAMHATGRATATISSQNEGWQGMLRFQQTATPTHYFHSPDYDGEHLYIGSEHVVPDHVTVDRAMRWIDDRDDEPWALYVNLQSTHFSYRVPTGHPEPFQPTGPLSAPFSYFDYAETDLSRIRNRYDNALHYVDAQIGRLTGFLEERGQLRDTLLLITADHGESFHDHGLVTHGRTLFDSEARVPWLIHWPAALPARDVHVPTTHLDVLPTALDLAGLPPHPALQGKSLTPVLRGASPTTASRRAIFMNIQGLRSMRGVICWPFKLVVDDENESTTLFDLASDPAETASVAHDHPRVAASLGELLTGFLAAQRRYHATGDKTRTRRYAPRIPTCPELRRGVSSD